MKPPPGFSTPPQMPNITTSERPPVTTTVFAATTLENTPFAYHASTSNNPNHTISPAFVEAKYEIIKSLLRERRRQIRNEDLRTELEYFSEDYDEEREMEPMPEPRREATPTLRLRSTVVYRQRERVVEFEDAPNRKGNRRGRNVEDSARIWWNSQKTNNILNYEDLKAKFRSHFSHQKKFTKTHLAVHNVKQREGESTRAFITRYTDDTLQILGLHKEQRISGFVHGLRTRSLVKHLSTDLPSTYKGLMEKTYTWVEAREVATNARVNSAPVIIEAKIFGRKVGRVYMDGESSCEIIYESCFEKLNLTIKATKVDLKTPLVGFSGEHSWSVSEVPLEITIGDAPLLRTETLNFVIVRFDSPHNMLFRRTVMQRMGIVVLTIHVAIKFHTKKGIRTVLSTNEANEGTKRAKRIPSINVFAWTHADMTEISRTIMIKGKPFNTEHKLNECSHIKPIKQNKRGLGPDCSMAAYKETEELIKAGILRKAKRQTWVANPVMVKRVMEDGEYAYKGYHQIQMVEEDEEKTAFYAGEGVFCYKKMPFGLKNAKATYQ
nr:hypothetical protein [Tanacetum cinerariifolium]